MPKRAVFLDRDGTLIYDRCYMGSVDDVELIPGAAEALARLHEQGFLLVLITNQSGIGRGYFAESIVHQQHQRLGQFLKPFGIDFADIRYCPHTPDDRCHCRKPEPGMLTAAAKACDIELTTSYMIGDKPSDTQAGRAAGCTTVLLTDAQAGQTDAADMTAPNLQEAADLIIAHAARAATQ